MTALRPPRRLDRRPLRRGGALPAGAGAGADRHAARQQRAARRAHRRAAGATSASTPRRIRCRQPRSQAARPAVDHQPDRAPPLRRPAATIALNAHGDVVPPGEGWTHDPYGGEIVDGRLYGRAAAVSKSDFATFTFAVRALEVAAARRWRGGVELHFTYDEEFGGELGPGWLLQHGLTQARPADRRRLQLPGRDRAQRLPADGGDRARQDGARRDPDTGVDALQGAIAILNALYAQNDALRKRRSQVAGITPPVPQRRPHRGRHQHQRRARQGRAASSTAA